MMDKENKTNETDFSLSQLITARKYLVTIYAVTMTDIIFGNLLIIISVCKFRRLRTKPHILIFNLATSDLLVGLIVIPYEFSFLLVDGLSTQKYGCLCRSVLATIFLGAAIWSLFFISLERYFAIVYPFIHVKLCTPRRLFMCIVWCWTVAFAIGLIPIFGWNKWQKISICDSRIVLPTEYILFVYILYIGILLINFILFIKIVRTAWMHIDNSKIQMGNTEGRRHQNISKNEIKRTKGLVLVLGVFAICWGPFIIYIVVEELFLGINLQVSILRMIFRTLAIINSGLNWLIYGVMNKHFRHAFLYILSCARVTKYQNELLQSSMRLGNGSQTSVCNQNTRC